MQLTIVTLVITSALGLCVRPVFFARAGAPALLRGSPPSASLDGRSPLDPLHGAAGAEVALVDASASTALPALGDASDATAASATDVTPPTQLPLIRRFDDAGGSELRFPAFSTAPLLPNVAALPEGAPVAAAAEESVEAPSIREIVIFALPTLAMMLSSPLLSLIDTSVVGLAASTSQLAALGPSTKACDHLAYLCSALGVACTSLAARELAKDNPSSGERARRIVSTCLTSALAIGTVITLLLSVGAAPLMRLIMGGGGGSDAAAFAVSTHSYPLCCYPTARLLA